MSSPKTENLIITKGQVVLRKEVVGINSQRLQPWQRKIASILRTTFPNVQFILTTHSPQVLGELREGFKILSLMGLAIESRRAISPIIARVHFSPSDSCSIEKTCPFFVPPRRYRESREGQPQGPRVQGSCAGSCPDGNLRNIARHF